MFLRQIALQEEFKQTRSVIVLPYQAKDLEKPIILLYLRPETNNVYYEGPLIENAQKYGPVIYLASLNGLVLMNQGLYQQHYRLQDSFSKNSKYNMSLYPEFVAAFENKFNESFAHAEIISGFEESQRRSAAINYSHESTEPNPIHQMLFNSLHLDNNLLKIHGINIKKIENHYVVCPELPYLFYQFDKKKDMFFCAVKLYTPHDYEALNQNLFDDYRAKSLLFNSDEASPEFTSQNKAGLRHITFHISHGLYIAAMFDLLDFVYTQSGEKLSFTQTPLGKILAQEGFSEMDILGFKNNPLQYIEHNGQKVLINIIEETRDYSLEQCIALFKKLKS